MVLSQPDIRRAVDRGEIVFDPPLEESQWGEASVDLRLSFSFTKLKRIEGMKISVAKGLGGIATAGFWETMVLKERNRFGQLESFDLEPQDFVLCLTHESVKVPRNMIALVEGRSTYA